MRALLAFLAVSYPGLLSGVAFAQESTELSASVGAVSDYRFRGVSLSDRDPAIQGGIEVANDAFFVGAWASNIAEYDGADVEIDAYAGLRGDLADIQWTAGAYVYLYPGGADVSYAEIAITGEREWGPVTLGVEAALVPRQRNIGEVNRYLAASSTLDLGSGWALAARSGHESGFYQGKWDWELGASYTAGPLTASVAYVDTNLSLEEDPDKLGKAGIVGALTAAF